MADMEDKSAQNIRKREETDKKACLATYSDAAIKKVTEKRIADMQEPESGDPVARRNALRLKTAQEGITNRAGCLQEAKEKARRAFIALAEETVKQENKAAPARKRD
jgi:hypothetical protein